MFPLTWLMLHHYLPVHRQHIDPYAKFLFNPLHSRPLPNVFMVHMPSHLQCKITLSSSTCLCSVLWGHRPLIRLLVVAFAGWCVAMSSSSMFQNEVASGKSVQETTSMSHFLILLTQSSETWHLGITLEGLFNSTVQQAPHQHLRTCLMDPPFPFTYFAFCRLIDTSRTCLW
jgi:hypothetical protein